MTTQQHGGSDTVDVDDAEIRGSHRSSMYLTLCDYEVFGSLKKFLEGKCFSTDKEVKRWMLQVEWNFG